MDWCADLLRISGRVYAMVALGVLRVRPKLNMITGLPSMQFYATRLGTAALLVSCVACICIFYICKQIRMCTCR